MGGERVAKGRGRSLTLSLYGRFFAAIYDRLLAASEEAGLADRRSALLANAEGRVVEIGAGTGLNLDRYPAQGVEELVLAEPEGPMARRLRERLAASGREGEVVEAPAERLPFADDTFDTAVSTLVLCTVTDLEAALAEVRRVLKPDGQLLFLEHVRWEDDPGRARWQDRLTPVWRRVGHGCHPNRRTLAAIETAGLHVRTVEYGRFPKAISIVEPLIQGVAVNPA